ncbi:hypothetical protein TSA1_24620 [Bradyrhizobium nitroreducens]|uniref:Nicotinate phosphoribosyltransferase N-terminal domain-containing protein n=2 Tax=Bradyrhizobium TaxID=374 RepID=A0A2M6UGC2_9BRAD|nr:hypothetical protein [Bradyrhizobium nitroreducens]PIT03595.1 hypothetical protein TSA1_24620 [Bradyrhizobium nitroreducens]
MSPSALLTDLYQLNMVQAYLEAGQTETTVFEFFVRKLRSQRNFLVAAGLEQALEYLQGLRFSDDAVVAARLRNFARGHDYVASFADTAILFRKRITSKTVSASS